jgi:uncharacterized protein
VEYKKSMYNNMITSRIKNDKTEYLIYNSSTGAMAWLEKWVYSAMAEGNISVLKKEKFFNELQRNGFVVLKEVNEYFNYMFKAKSFALDKHSDFASYIVAPTMRCNLKCLYCFEECNNDTSIMSEDMLEAVYLFITKNVMKESKHRLNINWFGGEPLLAYKQIKNLSKKLISFCDNHKIEYRASVVTNGTLLTKSILEELIDECRVKHFQISFDGESAEYQRMKKATNENFNRAIQSIEMISKSCAGISVRLNVCYENKDSLLHLAKKIVKISDFHGIMYAGKIMKYDNKQDYSEISAKDFEIFENNLNEYASTYSEYQRYVKKSLNPKGASCGYMVKNRCLIDPHGRLYRCEHHINDIHYVIGDVINGFYRNELDYMFVLGDLPDKCQKCSIMPICMGGCSSDRILHQKFVNCDYMKRKLVENCILVEKLKHSG